MDFPAIEYPQDLCTILTDLHLTGNDFSSSVPYWEDLVQACSHLQGITLEEMSEVRLMNRIDVKYMLPLKRLPDLIEKIEKEYHIQEINGNRIAGYGTVYLDTKELKFFHMHVNGKLNHIKWRIRNYKESNISFLEIKRKSNKGRTHKSRIPFDAEEGLENAVTERFIREKSGYGSLDIQSVLENSFNRITLVNIQKTERLTIDFNVAFRNCLNGHSILVGDLAIIEIKQNSFTESVLRNCLDEMRIKKSGISKYCLGLAMTTGNIKRNLYKQKIRRINKILLQNESYCRT